MQKLSLLFTKDGLQYQLIQSKSVLGENSFFVNEESPIDFVDKALKNILNQGEYDAIQVISAINHFTLMPAGFSSHDLGYTLVGYNADTNREEEDLMLSVNKKFGVQFYYTFPKKYYNWIKEKNPKSTFNFSGEKFLNSLQNKKPTQELHINLYHHQVEFFALKDKKVILYNNLDVTSEVDFLYFIMFSLSKIDFKVPETAFYVYGETTVNETFISELKKFVKKIHLVFENIPSKNFILTPTF